MSNFKTRAVTEVEYKNIITALRTGFILPSNQHIRPNEKVAVALTLEANMGMRINDILHLKLSDIKRNGGRYHLNVKEEKTGKLRTFMVPVEIYAFIQQYAIDKGIKPNQRLFDITTRAVQNSLKLACKYLEIDGVSTHSFRKFFAQMIYDANDNNIELVRELLQHSSIAVTQHYIGVDSKIIEKALQKHVFLPA